MSKSIYLKLKTIEDDLKRNYKNEVVSHKVKNDFVTFEIRKGNKTLRYSMLHEDIKNKTEKEIFIGIDNAFKEAIEFDFMNVLNI